MATGALPAFMLKRQELKSRISRHSGPTKCEPVAMRGNVVENRASREPVAFFDSQSRGIGSDNSWSANARSPAPSSLIPCGGRRPARKASGAVACYSICEFASDLSAGREPRFGKSWARRKPRIDPCLSHTRRVAAGSRSNGRFYSIA